MRGFTLIEVLIALVIFEFGMLALAATTAVAARDLGVANRRMQAHAVARSRVELLRAGACGASTIGTADLRGGLREFWRTDAIGSRRVITDSIEYAVDHGRRASFVLHGWTLCTA